MGFQMGGSGGGMAFLLIYRVLRVFITNPFSCSFSHTIPRGVFEHMIRSLFKKTLEPAKFQEMRNFQSWYQIFGNSWMYFNFGGSLKTHRDSKIHMIPWEKVFEIWRWCKLQKCSPWHELYILARYEHFTSICEHVTRISHGIND